MLPTPRQTFLLLRPLPTPTIPLFVTDPLLQHRWTLSAGPPVTCPTRLPRTPIWVLERRPVIQHRISEGKWLRHVAVCRRTPFMVFTSENACAKQCCRRRTQTICIPNSRLPPNSQPTKTQTFSLTMFFSYQWPAQWGATADPRFPASKLFFHFLPSKFNFHFFNWAHLYTCSSPRRTNHG